jgi:hypothetical protein
MGPSKDAMQFFQRFALMLYCDNSEFHMNWDFFQIASMGHPVPRLYNPSDHYINVLSVRPTMRERALQNINVNSTSNEFGFIKMIFQ